MKVRATDVNGDWVYGKSLSDYKRDNDAIAQNIVTSMSQVLGDCFFATDQGVDWFNLMGSKSQNQLDLILRGSLLNNFGVTGIVEFSLRIDQNRKITIQYEVTTIFTGVAVPTATIANTIIFLTTEAGLILTTEAGAQLQI